MCLGVSGFELKTKRTRKREFLVEMEQVVPWRQLVSVVAPFAPEGKSGRPPFSVVTMLRTYFIYGPDAFCKLFW
jgi:IS5 family transposase